MEPTNGGAEGEGLRLGVLALFGPPRDQTEPNWTPEVSRDIDQLAMTWKAFA